MIALTARQQQILNFIKRCIQDNGIPPTRADIASAMGFRSPNAAEDHLKALAKKGAIVLTPGTSRGIRVIQSYAGEERLPVVGRVAAGAPILAQEHISDYLDLPANTFSPKAHYFLKVNGMSMRDAGILDKDLLAVHRTHEASNGQIVVARLDDEVTVKRIKRQGEKVLLLAENSDYAPIEIDLETKGMIIEGLGVGVIRKNMQ